MLHGTGSLYVCHDFFMHACPQVHIVVPSREEPSLLLLFLLFVISSALCFQVVVAPYGDAVGEEGERQSVAVVTNVESEDLLTSASFPTVVRTPKLHHQVASVIMRMTSKHDYIV